MKRDIIALLFSLIIWFVITILNPLSPLESETFHWGFSLLASGSAGFVAGLIGQQKGWKLGLLAQAIISVYILIFSLLDTSFSKELGIRIDLLYLIRFVLFQLPFLLIASFFGFLGEKLRYKIKWLRGNRIVEINKGKKWPGYVFVTFGIANILHALAGISLIVLQIIEFRFTLQYYPETPYYPQAFLTMTAINIFFLIGLVITGFYLIKKDKKIISYCNVLFFLELIYFVITGMLWLAPEIGSSIGRASGTGNMGVVLQKITGYPIIALILLNIAKAKHRKVE